MRRGSGRKLCAFRRIVWSHEACSGAARKATGIRYGGPASIIHSITETTTLGSESQEITRGEREREEGRGKGGGKGTGREEKEEEREGEEREQEEMSGERKRRKRDTRRGGGKRGRDRERELQCVMIASRTPGDVFLKQQLEDEKRKGLRNMKKWTMKKT